ncbi:A24 family peptidase [Desulfosporosinus metallidurans]|uniref:Type IV prepilin peptidase TadV/CpaA n=1 Tax=Desulfosporosinus metallidurans TaxID=1888891 RepID=A0A1Q8R217_9FIRM|nr:A24 family peptidase [Desulfosporosinus metallidurans]OLN33642.1 Type IV prepilin peptidase TadV/CpaA [Desulfosporosinus metallidurans]
MGMNEVALGITLGIAVFTDWREHKIYNKLLFPAFFIALLLHTVQGGVFGLANSLLGATVGFALLLLPYFMGGMGAGDVKLLAVIGAFGGVPFVLTCFLYGAIIGGLISSYLLARRKALGNTLRHFLVFFTIFRNPQHLSRSMSDARQEKFPYGIAIALGTLIALFSPLGGGGS